MPTTPAATIPAYLPQSAAAAYLHHSPRTLEQWRVTGYGPAFHKVGSRVLYAIADLEIFIAAGRRTSTSDTGRAAGDAA